MIYQGRGIRHFLLFSPQQLQHTKQPLQGPSKVMRDMHREPPPLNFASD